MWDSVYLCNILNFVHFLHFQDSFCSFEALLIILKSEICLKAWQLLTEQDFFSCTEGKPILVRRLSFPVKWKSKKY